MDMVRESTLEVMVKTKSIMCANWSTFEHSYLLFFLKVIILSFEVQSK